MKPIVSFILMLWGASVKIKRLAFAAVGSSGGQQR
jgi:hypothetical protein